MSKQNFEPRVVVLRDTVSRQNFAVPAGTVLHHVCEFPACYRGLLESPEGKFFVTIPKGDCRESDPLPA